MNLLKKLQVLDGKKSGMEDMLPCHAECAHDFRDADR